MEEKHSAYVSLDFDTEWAVSPQADLIDAGMRFWTDTISKEKVTFDVLAHALQKQREFEGFDYDDLLLIVKYVIDVAQYSDLKIETEEWQRFLLCFGPFEDSVAKAMSLFEKGVVKPWFHGDIQFDDALAMFTAPGQFFVCYHTSRDATKIKKDSFIIFHSIEGESDGDFSADAIVVTNSKRGYTAVLSEGDSITCHTLSDVVDRLSQRYQAYFLEPIQSPLFASAHALENVPAASYKSGSVDGQVVEMADKVMVAVNKFFATKADNVLTRHWVYWQLLTTRVKNFVEDEEVAESKSTYHMYQLVQILEIASDTWDQMCVMPEHYSQVLEKSYSGESSLKTVEEDCYDKMSTVLEDLSIPRLFDAARRSGAHPGAGEDNTEMMTERKLFWYRFFGVREREIKYKDFAYGLWLYLQQEYGRRELSRDAMTRIVLLVCDTNSDKLVQLEEWRLFIYRYGPLEMCYDKAKMACRVAEADGKSEFTCSDWFRHFERGPCEKYLLSHRNNAYKPKHKDYPPSRFYLRPGKPDLRENHAFSFSFVKETGNPFSTRVRIDGTGRDRKYYLDGESRRHPNVLDLVKYAATKLKWPNELRQIEKDIKAWENYESRIEDNSEATSPEAQVLALVKFFETAADGALAKEVQLRKLALKVNKESLTPPEKYTKRELRALLESRDLKKLQAYFKFTEKNQPHASEEADGKRTVAKSMTHFMETLVSMAFEDRDEEGWMELLENITNDDIIYHAQKCPAAYAIKTAYVRLISRSKEENLRHQHRLFEIVGLLVRKAHVKDHYLILAAAVETKQSTVVENILQILYDNKRGYSDEVWVAAAFTDHFQSTLEPTEEIPFYNTPSRPQASIWGGQASTVFHIIANFDLQHEPLNTENHLVLCVRAISSFFSKYMGRVGVRNRGNTFESYMKSAPIVEADEEKKHDPVLPEEMVDYLSMVLELKNQYKRTALILAAEPGLKKEVPIGKILTKQNNYMPKRLIKALVNIGARCDVMGEDDNTLLHYMLKDLSWFEIPEEEMPALLELFDGVFHSIVNSRNSENASPLAILLTYIYGKDSLENVEFLPTKGNIDDFVIWMLRQGAYVSSIDNFETTVDVEKENLGGGEMERHPVDTKKLMNYLQSLIGSYMVKHHESRWNIMHSAVRNGDEKLVELILSNTVKPYVFNPRINDGLHTVHAKQRRVSRMNTMTNEAPRLTRVKSPSIIDRPKSQSSRNGALESLLHIAVKTPNRRPAIVEKLLEYAPSEATINKNLEMVVDAAKAKSEVYKQALTANNGAVDNLGKTALHIAASLQARSRDTADIAQSLMSRIDIVKKDNFGWTALHYASDQNRLDIVDQMISVHVDVNVVTKRDSSHLKSDEEDKTINIPEQTALHIAARKGHWQIVSSLIKAGAEIDVVDDQGHTPLNLAMTALMQFNRMREVLALKDSDPFNPDDDVGEVASGCFPCSNSRTATHGDMEMKTFGSSQAMTIRRRGYAQDFINSAKITLSDKEIEEIQRQYKTTIDVLLNNGAQMDKATDLSQRGAITQLLDVKKKWAQLQNEVNRIERQLYEKSKVSSHKHRNHTAEYEQLTRACFKVTCNGVLKRFACEELETVCTSCNTHYCFQCGEEWDDDRHSSKFMCVFPQKTTAEESDRLEKQKNNKTRLMQQRDDVWEDKTNQIVIDEFYKTMVRDKHGVRLFLYLIFVVLLTVLGILESTSDARSAHYLHRALTVSMVEDEIPERLNQNIMRSFETMDSNEEFYLWAKGPFLDVLYPEEPTTIWEGTQKTNRSDFYINHHTRVLGVPRFRQIRSREESCDISDGEFNVNLDACFTTADDQERTPYGETGQYTWSESGYFIWGLASWYDDSGYSYELPVPSSNNRASALAELESLEGDDWVDAKTRAVAIEFSAYNGNENHFVWVQLLVEFPRAGGMITSHDIIVTKLRRYMTSEDNITLILELIVGGIMLIQVINLLITSIRGCSKKKPVASGASLDENEAEERRCCELQVDLSDSYAILNMAIIGGFLSIIVLHIVVISKSEDINWNSQGYVDAQELAQLSSIYTQVFSVVVFMCWFKILEYLSVFRALSRLVIMIQMMLRELVNFAVLLLIVLVAFASAEYIAYGYREPDSFTWLYGFITRLSFAFAGREISSQNSVNRVLGVIYPILFVIAVSLLLLNLLIAILTSAYEKAAKEAGESYWASWQYEMIKWEYTFYSGGNPTWISLDRVLIATYSFLERVAGSCSRTVNRLRSAPPVLNAAYVVPEMQDGKSSSNKRSSSYSDLTVVHER